MLGFSKKSRRLSDEQFIENIRKLLKISRWKRCFLGIVGVFFSVLSVVAFVSFADFVGRQQLPIFGLAVTLGLMSGLWLCQSIFCLADALLGERTERLLVACWDDLHGPSEEADDERVLSGGSEEDLTTGDSQSGTGSGEFNELK